MLPCCRPQYITDIVKAITDMIPAPSFAPQDPAATDPLDPATDPLMVPEATDPLEYWLPRRRALDACSHHHITDTAKTITDIGFLVLEISRQGRD